MKKRNHLSENLKSYQKQRGCSLAEFSEELGVARSTLRSVMREGNTTLDTLLRLGDGLEVTLNELVYGERPLSGQEQVQALIRSIAVYCELPVEKQEEFWRHLNGIMEVIRGGRG